ncbi:hypothetical protein BHF56_23920 [Escherichia coli]|nr:hypothetical protein BHF56_23920 [Escherichia coli]
MVQFCTGLPAPSFSTPEIFTAIFIPQIKKVPFLAPGLVSEHSADTDTGCGFLHHHNQQIADACRGIPVIHQPR